MRDALELGRDPILPYLLSVDDYYLGLVALQAGVWEAARDAHSFAADGLATKLKPGNMISVWLTHLALWRVEVEREHGLAANYWCSTPGDESYSIAPLTLALWNTSSLKLHAPLRLLRMPANYSGRGHVDTLSTQHPRDKLWLWMGSDCCRTSVWHGVQRGRMFDHEMGTSSTPSTRLKMNPIIVPGVLMGAVTVCFYAYQIRACTSCTGNLVTETVDLFAVEHGSAQLNRWKEIGEGLAVLGPLSISICQCNMQQLAAWFRRLLARDETARGEFETFLAELEKGFPGRG